MVLPPAPLFSDPPGAVDVLVEAGDVVVGDSRLLYAPSTPHPIFCCATSASPLSACARRLTRIAHPGRRHAAHPNDSDERRTGLTLWYIADFDNLPPPFQAYWGNTAKPNDANRPASAKAWEMMRAAGVVPERTAEGVERAEAMFEWQGTGPPAEEEAEAVVAQSSAGRSKL